MRLKFVTIGQNLKWLCGRLGFARKKKHRREFMTLGLARVISSSKVSTIKIKVQCQIHESEGVQINV